MWNSLKRELGLGIQDVVPICQSQIWHVYVTCQKRGYINPPFHLFHLNIAGEKVWKCGSRMPADENAVPPGLQVAQPHYISVLHPEDEVYGEHSTVLRSKPGLGSCCGRTTCGWWPSPPRGIEVENEMRYQERVGLGRNWREAWPVRADAESVQLDNVHLEGGQGPGGSREWRYL